MTRLARCGCGATVPSDTDSIAFFEDRSAGSRAATNSCKHCGYSECAHDPAHMETLVHLNGKRRPTQVEAGRCPGFEPKGEWEFDSYYCGCRGWD